MGFPSRSRIFRFIGIWTGSSPGPKIDAELDSGSSMAVLAAASEKPVFRIPYGKWDMALLDGFLESLRRGELEETVREEKEKLSEFAGPCDGRNGERIAEWLNKILNGI